MKTFGINYGHRLKGPGTAVNWTDDAACVAEAMRICRDKENALSQKFIAAFGDANGWRYDSVGQEGEIRYRTPTGIALVVHRPDPIDLGAYPGATIDELPAALLLPGMRAYVIRQIERKP